MSGLSRIRKKVGGRKTQRLNKFNTLPARFVGDEKLNMT
jgi:hypothetical protein